MGTPTHYANAPITEAIIDLRATFAEEIEMAALEAAISSEARDYPDRKRLQKGMGQFHFGPSVSSSAVAEDLGFAITSVDGKQIAQFRRDGFTFSRLTPYQSWGPFSTEARRLWNTYRNKLAPTQITRLAVRYINRIPLPRSSADISHWLNTYPELPKGVSDSLAGFFMHVTAPMPDLRGALTLIETVDDRSHDLVTSIPIILDLDLFRIDSVPQDEEAIWQYFGELHDRKNQVFEACLTDKTRELLR